ncbi:MAG: ATP-dependent helicase HrpA [Pseudohongiellaceae bacterium]
MLESLEQELDSCQIVDTFRLRRKLQEVVKDSTAGFLDSNAVASLAESIKISQKKCQVRNSSIPAHINFPDQLPVSAKADEIAKLLSNHQVLVVAGDTGSGKTTQIPKMCLAAGLGRRGLIGHTQPRRLAAVSVADRIAEELGVQVGQGVGYQVRFNEKVGPSTFLKLMTDGILLAEIQQDPFLNRYEVIIIDEAHERSLNIDFLLGFLKQLLPKRPDLKLIITSATIDLEKFSKHFDSAPIVSVSGRTFPVVTEYMPLLEASKDKDSASNGDFLVDGVVDAVARLYSENNPAAYAHNDVLVFLASEREIRETAIAFRKRRLANTEILPLYARLRHSEQVKIFKPHKGRRVVLSTNVAETSLTVPGIRYVVDTGFARISRYSLQSKVQRLPIEAVSQASANQRQGRCGRIADGVCIRLYSETDFNSRALYTDPEIRRTNLASVILKMRYMRLGDVDKFPFLEAPATKAVNEGFKLLYELNALTPARELTRQGSCMAKLPVDPKFARMLVVAESRDCLSEILIIVSALSTQDPRETNAENRSAAHEALQKFNHPDSDFLSFVNLWHEYEIERQRLNQSQLRKFCKQNFLSYMRMREWREIHRQLLLSCQSLGWKINSSAAEYQPVHESIISGSLNQIACKSEGNEYLGNRNRKFKLLSSSVLSKKQSDWIVTGDLIETHQVFASMAAKVQPEWVENMALHLVKREYFEPHWSKKRQQVMAFEKVHLYGLTLLEKAQITFSDVDPVAAREIFISEGLTGRQLKTNLPFYAANQAFLDALAKQEDKIRRPDYILSESDIIRFYDECLPESVLSTRTLEAWFRDLAKQGGTGSNSGKKNGRSNLKTKTTEAEFKPEKGDDASPTLTAERKIRHTLYIEHSQMLAESLNGSAFDQFPDLAMVNRNHLSINYVFDPSNHRDGATIDIPQLLLSQLTQADIDWAVPGNIREKCITLIKGLPKATRKNFIPVSGFVDHILPLMSSADGSLTDALIRNVRNLKKLNLTAADFGSVEIPKHLLAKIRILDESGLELGFGGDLAALKRDFSLDSEVHNTDVSASLHPLECQGLTDWNIDELPKKLEVGDDLLLIRYPALVDEGESIGVKLFTDQAEAVKANRSGLLRLLMLRSVQQRNSIRKSGVRFLNSMALKMNGASIIDIDQLLEAAYFEAFQLEVERPETKLEFDALLESGKSKLIPRSEELQSLLTAIVDRQFGVRKLLREKKSSAIDYAVSDITAQLSNLVFDGFLEQTPVSWLQQFPRYLAAIEQRLSKAPHLGPKDQEISKEISQHWKRYERLRDSIEIHDNELVVQLRWMLEEYRVSAFAQNLGTKVPVSAKRIQKKFELFR